MPDLGPQEQRQFRLIHRILGAEPGEQVAVRDLEEKLRQWSGGLSTQDEFALLVAWSERAKLLHTLDEVIYIKGDDEEIPDFHCVLSVEGKEVAFLVEVKSTTKTYSKLTRKYLDGLQRYGNRLGLPVLLAHKCSHFGRPLWNLVELGSIRAASGAGKAHPLDMMKRDLMTVLLGNFHVTIWQGASFVLKVSKERIIEQKDGGYSFVGRIQDVYWENKDGQRVDDVPGSFLWMFMMVDTEEDVEDHGDIVVIKYGKQHDDGLIAYWALPAAVDPAGFIKGEAIDWHKAALSPRFAFTLPRAQEDMEVAIRKGLVRYVFNVMPHNVPAFLLGVVPGLAEKGRRPG